LKKSTNLRVLIVVKKFGLCGGMEEYAFRLANELSKLKIETKVLCEEIINNPWEKEVECFRLGHSPPKPRWLNHIFFAIKVKKWVNCNVFDDTIIHSHERLNCHHVTTVHSTLFNLPKVKKIPTFRSLLNEIIEQRELNSNSVQKVVPVSNLIKKQISQKYPTVIPKLTSPIHPAVEPLDLNAIKCDLNKPRIGFMGREWKRKGLIKVIEIWRLLRLKIPSARLVLAGFDLPCSIKFKSDELKHVECLGFIQTKEDFYKRVNLLLHPAKMEAYGMVIPEALSIGIPVICSTQTGAAQDPNLNSYVLDVNESSQSWADVALKILNSYNTSSHIRSSHTWSDLALSYKGVYSNIIIKKH
jgi:UDP-glucose:(heptosyl)LPS alpha-1,3-glucosyltransferase